MNIDQIIGKLMGDGSVGEEKSALEAWKKEAEDNIKALEDMRMIDSISDTLKGYEDFDVENAWDAFSDKIEEDISIKSPQRKETSIFSIANIARIAAIMVLVFGSIFIFNKSNSPIEETSFAEYNATGEILNVDFDDGTKITLDKMSNLKVIDERSVELKGRAHFDVEKVDGKQFKINLPVGNVVVLGTEFTIDTEGEATEIFVSEGSVRYELDNSTYVLLEGQLVKVVDNVATKVKLNDDNYDSWKNQTLIFRDDDMVEVVNALSRHYKKEIIIENKKAFAKCNVVGVYKNSSIIDILNDLRISHSLEFEIRGKSIYIVSAKC